MKPKETQVLGLLVTILLTLITYDLYIIYTLNAYLKLDQLDVTTSFAVVDAIFFQTIKLIAVSFGIFALSVQIRGILVQRDRLKNKILARLKNGSSKYDIMSSDKEFTLQDLVKEVNIQDESTKLNFEPVKQEDIRGALQLIDRYGTLAMCTITKAEQDLLINGTDTAKLTVLSKLHHYYQQIQNLTTRQREHLSTVSEDILMLQG